jgi:CobQ-like glutamine amidotransferase family enzyme
VSAVRSYVPPRPAPPRNPWLADLLLSWAIAHATDSDPEPLDALDDSLEDEAHAVAAARARVRGGRPA